MRLPRLPNSFVKARTQTMQFLGINLTENYQDGEMADCKGLSTLQYPTLSQRKGREALEGYSDMVTDIYEWGGHLVVVDNNTLYVDGDPIASVNGERKHFAVVNSRLIVFPDKISVDLRNNEFKEMEAAVESNASAGSVTFTHNSITATLEALVKKDAGYKWRGDTAQHTWSPFFYTYGTNLNAVKACWDDETSSWDMEALSALQEITAIGTDASTALNGIWPQAGRIFIPKLSGLSAYSIVTGNVARTTPTYPDTSEYNDQGLVGVITWVDPETWIGADNTFYASLRWDVYAVNSETKAFSSVFDVGDMVDVSGSLYGLLDTTHDGDDTTTSYKLKITGLSDVTLEEPNTITFADNSFKIPEYASKLNSDKAAGKYYVRVQNPSASSSYYYYKFSTDKRMLGGQYIVLYGHGEVQHIYLWDEEKHTTTASYSATRDTTAPSSTYTNLGTIAQYDTSTRTISIKRSIPDLDFICERDNRLWGVSNHDKTIYCSALGIPWDFYDYNGLDTGAYAVAVGSAGDFTGIVSYGGVLCFKENKVHKMLGSFPSDFYMTTYDVAGIAKGAERSAVIISEILYYRATLGVMAFTGYQPTNISPNLSLEHTTGGVGGTNGREYFLCVKAKEGEDHYSLFKYDLQLKLWIKEDDINVTSMANLENDLYINVQTKHEIEDEGQTRTIIEGRPYITGQQNEEGMNLEWFARFTPYIETQGGVRQAGYTRLVLRFDMAPGSVFQIKVRYDDGRWESAWTQPKTKKLTHTVPLRIKRCDKFELMLEGKGQTKIRSIQREFIRGGWYDGSGVY